MGRLRAVVSAAARVVLLLSFLRCFLLTLAQLHNASEHSLWVGQGFSVYLFSKYSFKDWTVNSTYSRSNDAEVSHSAVSAVMMGLASVILSSVEATGHFL